MAKSIKEGIEELTEKIEDAVHEAKVLGTDHKKGIKEEFKDIEKLRHHKELIYYESDALVIVIRKLGGFDEFLRVVDDLTRKGYWMMNSEDVKNMASNFGISLPGIARGTLYYFQNKKYIN
jgi:hypothetical protein